MDTQMLAVAYMAIGLISVTYVLCFGYFMVYLYTVLLVHKIRHIRRHTLAIPEHEPRNNMEHSKAELDSTGSTIVDKNYHWLPITDATPRNQKLQLIHRPSGSAQYGILPEGDTWFTHWARTPTFQDE